MLSIGEFSRLSRVSPRMLRHYDAIGLLRPEAVGSNGYRYYRQEQLRDIVAIQRWKEYGFPLCEIGELLKLSGPEQAQRLWRRCQAFREDLRAGGALLRRMEADALRMEGANAMENQYQVIVMEDPAQKVFSIRRTIGVAEYHTLFEDLRRGAAERGLRQVGPIQMRYFDQVFDHENADVEAQMVVAGDSPDVTEKPAFTCAAVEHRGSYETLHLAYEAVCAWLAEHTEYRVCAPAMDRYLNDPHQVSSAEDLRTGVLFPVERV